MIVFVEPNSRWYDFVFENRQHAPTLLIGRKFADMVMSTSFSNNFWLKAHNNSDEAFRHSIDSYKIWNEKLVRYQVDLMLVNFHKFYFQNKNRFSCQL